MNKNIIVTPYKHSSNGLAESHKIVISIQCYNLWITCHTLVTVPFAMNNAYTNAIRDTSYYLMFGFPIFNLSDLKIICL